MITNHEHSMHTHFNFNRNKFKPNLAIHQIKSHKCHENVTHSKHVQQIRNSFDSHIYIHTIRTLHANTVVFKIHSSTKRLPMALHSKKKLSHVFD